jgi:aminocarboxymuconate-semialdehyde decarboxylase
MGGAGQYGPELSREADGSGLFRVGDYKFRSLPGDSYILDDRWHDSAARLAAMDQANIDVMGVSVSPLTYFYWIDPDIAVPFATIQNEAMAKFCAGNPDRLFHFATVPLQDIDASVKELERAANAGARGLNLGQTDVALGRFPDDESFFPLYEVAERHGLPIFVHPYPPGIDKGEGENQLVWIAGYLAQSTMTGAAMLLGGVFDHFPNLKVILPHGGGAMPYQWGRFEYAYRRMRNVKALKSPDAYRANIFYDCLIHDVRARKFLIDTVGVDQVLVGDNYMGWDAVDGFAMIDELNLAKADEEKIMGLNAARIFNLDPAKAKMRR